MRKIYEKNVEWHQANRKSNFRKFIFSTIIIIIDFIIKLLALNNITNICVIPNFFYLTLAKNTGAAFSLLENKTIFFIIIGILVIFYIFKYLIKEEITSLEKISYILLTGGIVGNLIDRIIYVNEL